LKIIFKNFILGC